MAATSSNSWLQRISISRAYLRLLLIVSVVLLTFSWLSFSTHAWAQRARDRITEQAAHATSYISSKTNPAFRNLPAVYRTVSSGHEPTGLCADRYGLNYITAFGASAAEHCGAASGASLTCFTHTAHDERTDSFCYGVPAALDGAAQSIDLNCTARDGSEPGSEHFRPLSQFPNYWYGTGPHQIFNAFVHLRNEAGEAPRPDGGASASAKFPPSTERTLLLVKREDTVFNLWHHLMQVMSLGLSLDVLQSTPDPKTGRPYLSAADLTNSQVVILDHHDAGPFWDHWSLFSPNHPPTRFKDLSTEHLAATKIVIPLVGGSNPLWEGDWVDLPCDQSTLLSAFARRLLDFYHIPPAPALKPGTTARTLTMIDRRGSRKLVNQDPVFWALQSTYPDVQMQLVDFAALSFAEQLRVVQASDVLVGVHGAGLTHEFFMKPGARLVEIQPPDLDHRGFKNMAHWLGLSYWRVHGVEYGKGDWHADDVKVEEEPLVEAVGKAIRGEGVVW